MNIYFFVIAFLVVPNKVMAIYIKLHHDRLQNFRRITYCEQPKIIYLADFFEITNIWAKLVSY